MLPWDSTQAESLKGTLRLGERGTRKASKLPGPRTPVPRSHPPKAGTRMQWCPPSPKSSQGALGGVRMLALEAKPSLEQA